jgi:leucyl aminopeptidase
MKFVFSGPGTIATGALVIGVLDSNKLTPSAKKLDKKTGGALVRAIKSSSFSGKVNQSLTLLSPAGTKLDRILAVGLGKVGDINERAMHELGGQIFASLKVGKSKSVTILIDDLEQSELTGSNMAVGIAEGAKLRSYSFDKYQTKSKSNKNEKSVITAITLQCRNANNAKASFKARDKVIDGVFMTRDLVTEPPNIIYPETLAQRCKELSKLGVKVEVLGEKQMKRLGMGALVGVGQGSIRESKLVVMQWNGENQKNGKSSEPLCFVGKGVTFDTGGISLKPSGGMEDMKYDMGGSGVVIGLMKALAGRKAKINVVGIVGLAENMPGSNAQRPSDVVTSMSGQTIEVLNTDAEGRLVLADALYYANNRFKPKFIIDLATLTGAIIIALGEEYAGLFSNNDKLSERLISSGNKIGEKLWRLPQNSTYDKMINSDIADMKNISGGRGAGSITAAQFLGRFIGKTPWAHLDIAGVTWTKKNLAVAPKGATAFGVRLLDRMVCDYYEKK